MSYKFKAPLKTTNIKLKRILMKALKISLLLVAVVVLTVSVVSKDAVTQEEKITYKKDNSNFDLLAVNKKKRQVQQQG